GRCRARRGLAGRVLLPLPRLEVRHGRTSVQRRAGAAQPGGAAVPVHQRKRRANRRRYGGRIMSAATPADTRSEPRSRMAALVDWIDARFSMTRFVKEHMTEYYAPKNFNFWYYF